MPRLFVVPTPIGNLEDVTLRSLRVLREVPLILAEDTRRTRKLLDHYVISTPMRSYHQHNKLVNLDRILEDLRTRDLALVSDAGIPSLSDPGFELISAAVAAGIEVDVLPGASAIMTAVVAAAMPAPGFLFLGFMPRRAEPRRRLLRDVAGLPYSLVMFEAPHRLTATLADIETELGGRELFVGRELTKLHQEMLRGPAQALAARFDAQPPRGEITIVIGASGEKPDRTREALEELRERRDLGEDRRTVLADIAARFGVRRQELYRSWHFETERDEGPESS